MMDKADTYTRILIYVFMAILTLMSIFPFWVVLVNATRSAEQIQQGLSIFPGSNLGYNWNVLMEKQFDIFGGFKNSFIISACSTVLSIYFSAMAAYGLVAYKFKGRKILYAGILGLVMIPTQISMIGF